MNFQQPFEIYVLWHPNNNDGMDLANAFYSLFCRNYERPFESSLGIPVYFRFEKLATGAPKTIDSGSNIKTAVIALIDDNFVNDESHFHQYLEDLISTERKYPHSFRVYPVALTKNFTRISEELNKKNAIRAYDKKILRSFGQTSSGLIKSELLHEFSRFLLNLDKLSQITDEVTASPPIRLFISHSKHDKTLKQAMKFKNFVDSKSQVKTFFDVHDIAYGYDFEAEIKKGISDCALVVFQSDSYSSREWCRFETITAKSHNCPVVVVNALEKGEKRSFPYLGNVPTIRLNKNFQEIIDLTLEKVLYNLYQKELMKQIATMYGIDINFKISTYPELFDIINIKKIMRDDQKDFCVILYPDPPIGSEELKLLNEMDSNLFFITPNQLPTIEILNDGKQ